jgi:hypothetical protein
MSLGRVLGELAKVEGGLTALRTTSWREIEYLKLEDLLRLVRALRAGPVRDSAVHNHALADGNKRLAPASG